MSEVNEWGLTEQRVAELKLMLREFKTAEFYSDVYFYFGVLLPAVLMISFLIINIYVIYCFYKNSELSFYGVFVKVKSINYNSLLSISILFISCAFLLIIKSPVSKFNPHPGCNDTAVNSIDGLYLSSGSYSGSRNYSLIRSYMYVYDLKSSSVVKLVGMDSDTAKQLKYNQEYHIGVPIKATFYSHSIGLLPFVPDFFRSNYVIDFYVNGNKVNDCVSYTSNLIYRNGKNIFVGVAICFFYLLVAFVFLKKILKKRMTIITL